MLHYTRTVDKQEYKNTLLNVIDELEKIMKVRSMAYTINEEAFVTERLLTCLRQVQFGSPLEKLIKGQILEATYRSEIVGPNSTDMFLTVSVNLIREVIMLLEGGEPPQNIIDSMDQGYLELKKSLQEKKFKPKWEDIVESVHAVSKNKRIADMVLEAVSLSGLEGNIIPSHSNRGEYVVELMSGYNFGVSTYPIFTEEGGRWERKNVRVLVVDGVIERESEIHNIFTQAYKDQKPILLVARGYGEEVVATIIANKSLDICPIRVPFEVESINLIADISIVCGSQIVTPMKGDTVNGVNYDELPLVENVLCLKDKLNIIDSRYIQSVNNHVDDLSKRRENQSVGDMADLLSVRIKSLCSHTVHLRVGSKSKQETIKDLESADFSLRIVKGILDKGLVFPSDVTKEFDKFRNKRPTISVLSAAHHGIALIKSLAFTELAIMTEPTP